MKTDLKISVVTAAFNMESLVGETIKSVLDQKLDGDQYVFVDGASSDRTAEVARGFGAGIDVMISEPDEGQYHAIKKGFSYATGDILAWINADDILMPWTFSVVREIFSRFPQVDWITGSTGFLSDTSQLIRVQSKLSAYPRRFIANGWFDKFHGGYLQQESMFWRRSLWDKVGGLDTGFSLAADFDLWTRFAEHADLVPVDVPLAAFRERPGLQRSSSAGDRYEAEVAEIRTSKPPPPAVWSWAANKGLAARNVARLLIGAKHPAIAYDRRDRVWKLTTRRRSLSRVSISAMRDEYAMSRQKTELDE